MWPRCHCWRPSQLIYYLWLRTCLGSHAYNWKSKIIELKIRLELTFPFLKRDMEIGSCTPSAGILVPSGSPHCHPSDVAIFSSPKATTGSSSHSRMWDGGRKKIVTFLSREYSMSTENSSTSLCGPWSWETHRLTKVARNVLGWEARYQSLNSVFCY